jgi:hypothetical protein
MKHGDKIAAILSVGMFREGADWIQAQRVIDLIPSGSDQDRNQRFGRLIRDYPGKTCVAYYSFFPCIVDGDNENQRRDLSKLFAHFHASLVLENALVPIKVPKQMDSAMSENDGRRRRVNMLGRYDAQMQENIIADCHDVLVRLHAEAEKTGGTVGHKEALRQISSALEARGIHEQLEPLARQIVLILRRRANLNLPVEDLVEAGFDKVWASDALEGLRLYSAGIGGPTTFRDIRRAVYNVFERRWMEMYEQVRDLPTSPPAHSRAQWWIHYNRALQAKGLLSNKRTTLLERIPWWTWRESVESRFNRQYEALRALNRPPTPEEPLYVFVSATRNRYWAGKLSKSRIELLESIPWWEWRTRQSFEDLCREAALLTEEPKSCTRLHQWVWRTKQRYAKGQLSQEAITMVESIPWWAWESQPEAIWNRRYQSIAQLTEPPLHKERPKEYKFVHAQKEAYRAGRLREDRRRRLESIPWWTW